MPEGFDRGRITTWTERILLPDLPRAVRPDPATRWFDTATVLP